MARVPDMIPRSLIMAADEKTGAARRERIATACLAAMVGAKDAWGDSDDARVLAEIACDYADALAQELDRRAR